MRKDSMSDQQEQPPQWLPQQYPLQPAAHDEIEQQPFPQQSFWNQQPLSQNDQPTQPFPHLPQRRANRAPLLGVGLVVLTLLLIAGIIGGIALTRPVAATQHIKHIVFFVKENRTFDNYFGTYPGANGATSAMDSAGKMVPLHHERDQIPDINHSSTSARLAYDNGKMDRFDLIKQNKATAKNASGSSTLIPMRTTASPSSINLIFQTTGPMRKTLCWVITCSPL